MDTREFFLDDNSSVSFASSMCVVLLLKRMSKSLYKNCFITYFEDDLQKGRNNSRRAVQDGTVKFGHVFSMIVSHDDVRASFCDVNPFVKFTRPYIWTPSLIDNLRVAFIDYTKVHNIIDSTALRFWRSLRTSSEIDSDPRRTPTLSERALMRIVANLPADVDAYTRYELLESYVLAINEFEGTFLQ